MIQIDIINIVGWKVIAAALGLYVSGKKNFFSLF